MDGVLTAYRSWQTKTSPVINAGNNPSSKTLVVSRQRSSTVIISEAERWPLKTKQ